MSVDFDATIAWIDRPTDDGLRVFDGPTMAPVTALPLPLIALSAGASEVVGVVSEVFLDGQIVRARGYVWEWDQSRQTRQALLAGRSLGCGVNVMPVGGGPPTLEPDAAGCVRIYDWVIAGLTVYLDDTRPAWEHACLRARL